MTIRTDRGKKINRDPFLQFFSICICVVKTEGAVMYNSRNTRSHRKQKLHSSKASNTHTKTDRKKERAFVLIYKQIQQEIRASQKEIRASFSFCTLPDAKEKRNKWR